MLLCQWKKADGWDAPRIVPFGDITISPACIALHYGCEVNHFVYT
jgi:branched-chain amino acid aminotransferase